MSQVVEAPSRFRTVEELLHELGDIPADRVRLRPTPGTATERDLLVPEGRHCELVDGVLVEKPMGNVESMLTIEFATFLAVFVRTHRLGIVLGADGIMRLMPGLVRIPGLSFTSWDRLPGRRAFRTPIADSAPDLAIEVLSKSNTKREMEKKLREYFEAGVRLVWFVDPRTRTARVYTSPKSVIQLGEDQTLDGGEVLPGFTLPLRELFECLDRGDEG